MPDNDPTIYSVYEKVCKIERLLTGNGEPEKGLIVRVDRLDQAYKLWSRFFWMVCGAFLAPGIIAVGLWLVSKAY